MTTMNKPLYLDARAPLEVDVQGPALSVVQADHAPLWYPFARLSRIISRGPVQWSGAALCACMAAGVPVLFLDSAGRPTGLCTGSLRRIASLDEHLETVLSAPHGLDRFANWRRSQEYRLVHHLLRALDWSHLPNRPSEVARQLQHVLQARYGADHPIRLRWLLSILAAHSCRILTAAGLSPAQIGGETHPLNLGQEITRLAAWTLRGRILAGGHPLPQGLDEAARLYADHLEIPMTRCLDRLVQHLWRLAL